MADQTKNYGLVKPAEEDFYDISIFNGNADVVDQILKEQATAIAAKEALIKNAAVKTGLVDADTLPLSDSAASNGTKRITFANLKAALKVYFDGLYNKYTHPAYTPRAAGLYKVTVDATGHTSAVSAVAKTDITALGIPERDTIYTHPNDANTRHVTDAEKITWNAKAGTVAATTTANGLMAAADKVKLDGIAPQANKTTVANNLTTTAAGSALDAAQGKLLNDRVTEVNNQLTAAYDYIVNSQESFNNLIQSTTWLGSRSVLFAASIYTTSNIIIPVNVKVIHSSKGISITGAANLYLGYVTVPVTMDYEIRGLTLVDLYFKNCISLYGCAACGAGKAGTNDNKEAYGFLSCYDLYGCNGDSKPYGNGSGLTFSSCKRLYPCYGISKTYAFYRCTDLVNCNSYGRSGANYTAYYGCMRLTNCYGESAYGNCSAYNQCIMLSNCIGYVKKDGSGTAMCFLGCSQISNCKATTESTVADLAACFSDSSYLSSCIAEIIGLGARFNYCTNIDNNSCNV